MQMSPAHSYLRQNWIVSLNNSLQFQSNGRYCLPLIRLDRRLQRIIYRALVFIAALALNVTLNELLNKNASHRSKFI